MSSVFFFERLFDDAAQIDRRARDERQDLQSGKKKNEGAPPPQRCLACRNEGGDGRDCPICVALAGASFKED